MMRVLALACLAVMAIGCTAAQPPPEQPPPEQPQQSAPLVAAARPVAPATQPRPEPPAPTDLPPAPEPPAPTDLPPAPEPPAPTDLPPAPEPEPESAPVADVDAHTYCADFEANELRAEETYAGLVLSVTGRVKSVAKDIGGSAYVILDCERGSFG